MYLRNLVFVLCALSICSCNSSSKSKTQDDSLEIKHQLIQKGNKEAIEFTIYNRESVSINLLNPYNVSIESKSGSSWGAFQTLDCPCGASCPPPPTDFKIEPDDAHSLSWNMKKEWCGEKEVGGRPPQSFSEPSEPGSYRLKISFRSEEGTLQNMYHEFQIN